MSQSGNLKEESASGVGKAPSAASVRKCLAGESSAEQVEVRQVCGVNLGCVRIVSFLLSRFVDCLVAGIGVFVDLTVSNTPETARAGQPGAEAANAPANISKYRISLYHLLPAATQESREHPRRCSRPAALLVRFGSGCPAIPDGPPDAQPPAVPADFCVHRSSGTRRRVRSPAGISISVRHACRWVGERMEKDRFSRFLSLLMLLRHSLCQTLISLGI